MLMVFGLKNGVVLKTDITYYPEGTRRVGSWRDKHFWDGVINYPDGTSAIGIWKDGEKWKICEFDENGVFTHLPPLEIIQAK